MTIYGIQTKFMNAERLANIKLITPYNWLCSADLCWNYRLWTFEIVWEKTIIRTFIHKFPLLKMATSFCLCEVGHSCRSDTSRLLVRYMSTFINRIDQDSKEKIYIMIHMIMCFIAQYYNKYMWLCLGLADKHIFVQKFINVLTFRKRCS